MRRSLRIWTVSVSVAFGLSLAVASAETLGRWSPASGLARARGFETATALADGRVLVTGGFGTVGRGRIGPMASAEIFDPADGGWTSVAPLVAPRFTQTATRLFDGSVLVAGGANLTVGPLASAERYEPATDQWTQVGDMHTAHADDTATLLPDGRVLVVGGIGPRGFATRSAEIFDPRTDRWTQAARLHFARFHHTATLLHDSRVLVVGGEVSSGGNPVLLRSAEIYDPLRNRWTLTPNLSIPRANHVAVRLRDSRVLVAGGGELGVYGATAEIFNPSTGKWHRSATMTTKRAFATATLLRNGDALVAGGYTGQSDTATAERYSPERNRWLPAGRMRTARGHHAAVKLPDGSVLVVGGQRYNSHYLRGAEIYHPEPRQPVSVNVVLTPTGS